MRGVGGVNAGELWNVGVSEEQVVIHVTRDFQTSFSLITCTTTETELSPYNHVDCILVPGTAAKKTTARPHLARKVEFVELGLRRMKVLTITYRCSYWYSKTTNTPRLIHESMGTEGFYSAGIPCTVKVDVKLGT